MLNKNQIILVTGATGFVGGWIVETLSLSGFANIRAGIRTWSSSARIARFPIHLVECNVNNADEVKKVVDGADIVIHCAKGDRNVNIEGTQNVLSASAKSGVKSVVHLSTAEVYGSQVGIVDESKPYMFTGDKYADSKIEAEKLCQEYYKEGLPVTILRPSIVYGPFSDWWVVRFSQCLRSGNWGIFLGYGDGLCNLVYITDLISAIMLAANNKKAPGEVFNINGPDMVTWNEYLQHFNAGLGLSKLKEIDPRVLKIRSTIVDPIRATGNFMLNRFQIPIKEIYQRVMPIRKVIQSTQQSTRTTPSLHELSLFNRNAYYSDEKARKILGYCPKINIDNGIELCIKWLEQLGFIPETTVGVR